MSSPPITESELQWTVLGVDSPVRTWYRVVGDLSAPNTMPLILLHGGPGAVSDYLFPLTTLYTRHGIPLVFYDQIGNGRSTHLPEKKGDGEFWTEALFLDELARLLAHLGLDARPEGYDLLGHSWGGMLGARFAATHPVGMRRLVLVSAPASIPLWQDAANDLKKGLPEETQVALNKHEAEGTMDSEGYSELIMEFYKKHMCRLDPFPEEVQATFKALSEDSTVCATMFGPSDFLVTGTLKAWSAIPGLPRIAAPTLVLHGRYDVAQDRAVAPFFWRIPHVRWCTLDGASHFAHLEQPERFLELVGSFLTRSEGAEV